MAIDPIGASRAAVKLGDAVKGWPLWLLAAIAVCFSIGASVPDFRALVPPPFGAGLIFLAVAAWIFTAFKAMSMMPGLLAARAATRAVRTKFVITPVEHQSMWGIAKQQDGSFITQVTVRCMVKNRSSEPLQLMKARLVKPRIRGGELPCVVTMQGTRSNYHGTAFTSGYAIPPGEALPASANIMVRGMPRQRSGKLAAVVEFQDADDNRARTTLTLDCLSPPGPAFEGWMRRMLRRVKLPLHDQGTPAAT